MIGANEERPIHPMLTDKAANATPFDDPNMGVQDSKLDMYQKLRNTNSEFK